MDLTEIFTPGMVLTLKAKSEDAVADFETELFEIVGDCLLCEPILHEGKAVNFRAAGVKTELNVIDRNSGKLYSWRELDIKLGYYRKKKLCQLIYVKCEPKEINRRNNYRQYLGIPGKVTPKRGTPMDIVIRDASNNGIGFITEKKQDTFNPGKMIKINFSDEDGKYKFDLNCKIVREREMENGMHEYGCMVESPPYSLGQYVAHKQIEERKRVLGHL